MQIWGKARVMKNTWSNWKWLQKEQKISLGSHWGWLKKPVGATKRRNIIIWFQTKTKTKTTIYRGWEGGNKTFLSHLNASTIFLKLTRLSKSTQLSAAHNSHWSIQTPTNFWLVGWIILYISQIKQKPQLIKLFHWTVQSRDSSLENCEQFRFQLIYKFHKRNFPYRKKNKTKYIQTRKTKPIYKKEKDRSSTGNQTGYRKQNKTWHPFHYPSGWDNENKPTSALSI